MAKKSTPDDSRIAEAGAWQGTIPADGTRRGVILKAVEDFLGEDLGVVKAPLEVADAVELALLEHAEKAGAPAVEGADSWQFEFPEVNNPEVDESKWRWRLLGNGGAVVAQSLGYDTKTEAEEGAETFKAHAASAGFPIG